MSSIEVAEQLKQDLTDRYVIVRAATPELRRFSGLTGRVKTVNMNCRALVEFDGPVDIGWYDIDPSHLEVVSAPMPKTAVTHEAAAKAEAKPAAAKAEGKPAAAKAETKPAATAGGASPLDLIRKQGAAKPETAGTAGEGAAASSPKSDSKSAPAASPSGSRPSPIDLIRQKAAEKAASSPAAPVAASASAAPEAASAPTAPVAASAAAPAKPADDTAGLSPIEIIRRQAAAKRG